jgi:hypothetical protein
MKKKRVLSENPSKKLKAVLPPPPPTTTTEVSKASVAKVDNMMLTGKHPKSLVGKYLMKLATSDSDDNDDEDTPVKKAIKVKTPLKTSTSAISVTPIASSANKSIIKGTEKQTPTTTSNSSVVNSAESKKSVRFTGQTQAVKLNIISQKMKNPIPPSKSVPVPKSGVLKVKSMPIVSATSPPSRAGLLEINTRKNAKKSRRLAA